MTRSSNSGDLDHPRPDRRRECWSSLDGEWEFSFGDTSYDRRIVVPFAYQCRRSGLGLDERHEVMWYRRRFSPPEYVDGERVLMHFGAVDFEATVWVDGTEVGSHRGGHTSFTFDVTDALVADRDEHELTLRVVDEFRAGQLRGKQTATFPFFVHYTATSGIWQSVWVEVTGPSWIRESYVVAGADGSVRIEVDVDGCPEFFIRVTIGQGAGTFNLESTAATPRHLAGRLADVRPWSPSEPNLYDLRLDVMDQDGSVVDTVLGHVGFRTLEVGPGRWLLNGEPLYQRLLLDQGYWPESLITPPSTEAIVADLEFVRDAGFNGVRKHQKIEDPRFLWHADKMGLLVWEELPSPFGFAHIEGRLEADATAEWTEAVIRDRSHPCIIAWVPFNESWGLQDLGRNPERIETVRRMVELTRSLDPTRAVVDNSGWGHVDTDVVDVHDYDQNPERLAQRWTDIEASGWNRGPAIVGDSSDDKDLAAELNRWREFVNPDESYLENDRWLVEVLSDTSIWVPGCEPKTGTAGPLLLSEIGGVGLSMGPEPGDVFEYSTARDSTDLLDRFAGLIAAVEGIPEVVGWCWTELTDVEQEINGLMTADRRPKIHPAEIREVLDRLPRSPI